MDTAPNFEVDPELVERFRADLERLWIEHDEGGKLGVAVSGGPDSLALLFLAHAAMPGRIVAATVDHGLRPESAQEAAFVADVCADLGVPHATLAVTLEPGNVQERAREARYDALCTHFLKNGADALATAHHADDQAETVLMRLNRGSGVGGLAGTRAKVMRFHERPLAEFLVVRPLLRWRRSELVELVQGTGIEAVEDPSNSDERFDRVRMRKNLTDADWLDPLAIEQSARILQDAERIITREVDRIERQYVFGDGETIWFHWGHTQLEEVQIVTRILERFGSRPRGSAVARLIDQLRQDGSASLGGVLARRDWHQKSANIQCDAWRFEREPPRKAR